MTPGYSMKMMMARSLLSAALLTAVLAGRAQTSATPLPPETALVASSSAPAATEETFSIAAVASGMTQPDLLVTFTDLKTPSALSASSVVVTQGDAIVASTPIGASVTPTAAPAPLTLPAAVGQYTLRVIATADATQTPPSGSFSVCVAPKATPTACIAAASLTGTVSAQSLPADTTLSAVSITLTVATPGSYTFTYADAVFPIALHVPPTLALFQGSTPVAVPVVSASPLPLSVGTYTLLAFAQADPTIKAGLYNIAIAGPAGLVCRQSAITLPCSASYPVGLLAAASPVNNPNDQSLTLTVTDFAFPTALSCTSGAVVTAAGAVVPGSLAGTTGSGCAGPVSFMAPSGPLQVWSYATPGQSAGAYEVDLTSGSGILLQSLFQSDVGVNGPDGLLSYAITAPTALQAGPYTLTANDFQFPAPVTNLQFAVAQKGAVLPTQQGAAGSASFTAVAAPAVILVAAKPVTGGSGLVDLNIQTGGSTPQVVFDQIQPVSAAGPFTPLPITLGATGNYNVSLVDLMFPAKFGTLALVGASNGSVLGKIYGGGTFTVSANTTSAASAGLQFFVVAIPDTPQQQYGLYGLQILNAPPIPTVTLTASPTSVVTGKSTTLSWTTTNATACMASGGSFTGSQTTGSGTAGVTVSATTTYMLTCTGPGGSNSASVTVTATAAPPSSSGGHSGGGGLGLDWLGLLSALAALRLRRSMSFAMPAG